MVFKPPRVGVLSFCGFELSLARITPTDDLGSPGRGDDSAQR